MKQLFFAVAMLAATIAKTQSPNQAKPMKNENPYTILILMNATPSWLSLSREERGNYFEKKVVPIFEKFSKSIRVRLFDAEYFHSKISDFMIVETTDLKQYRYFIEYLRDTKIYGEPYFEIKDIVPGRENAFQEFNENVNK